MIKTDKHIKVNIFHSEIEVHAQNVAKLLDYPLESNDHMDEIIHNMIDEAFQIISPSCGYIIKRISNLNIKTGTLGIDGTSFSVGKIIAAQLRNAQYAALFYATIGNSVERKSKDLIEKGELMEGYTMDLIGSEAAEFLASQIHDSIETEAKNESLKITNRFSPGYCDWNVNEQFQLFDFFEKNQTGIELNDSALMSPIKSVSGLIGIGSDVKFKSYSCTKCNDENCIYRNKKSNKNQ